MEKLKRILSTLTKISLLCFAFFILSPSLLVQAVFSDTANINMGIELELGTVSLGQENYNSVESINYSGGDPVDIASSTLINDGSLTGKLAYKIDITNENGLAMTDEELKDVTVNIDFGLFVTTVDADATCLNTDRFVFAGDTSVKEVVMEPNSIGEIPIKISYKSNAPTKNEKIKVSVTFRLIQSNAVDANSKLFSDEKEVSNMVTLVPKVVKPESYWPEENTFIQKNGFSYSLKNMKMLFSETSETFNANKRQIKNLNKAVLYIQLPKDVPLTKIVKKDNGTTEIKDTFIITKLLTTLNTENGYSTGNQALIEESRVLDKEHHGIIITFRLQDEYSYNPSNPSDSLKYANHDRYSLNIFIEIQKYSMYKQGEYGYYSDFSEYLQFFATRVVLSSDTDVPISGADYIQAPIKLTNEKKLLTFKNFYTTSPQHVKPDHFKSVKFTNEIIELEVDGVNKEQVSYSQASINEFSIWLNSNNTFNSAILNVRITGDAGNTLVISRKLINSPQTQTTSIKSMKVPLINKETEEQTKQQSDTAKTIEEPNSTNDSTVPNEQTIEVPIEDAPQEDADDGDEETIDSSSIDSNSEIKEKAVPIENSDQTTPEEKSDEKINE